VIYWTADRCTGHYSDMQDTRALEMKQLLLIALSISCLVTGQPRDDSISISDEREVTVTAGSKIVLGCTLYKGGPDSDSSLEWVKGDVVVSSGSVVSDHYGDRAGVSVAGGGGVPVLTVHNVGEVDAGQYKCQHQGQQLDTYNVVLRGTQVIHSTTPSILTATPGDDITLTCTTTTSGSYKATVRWTRPGGTLPGGEEEVLADVLRIDGVEEGDSGAYQCTAMDDRGRSARRTVRVVVLLPEEGGVTSSSSDMSVKIWAFNLIQVVQSVVGYVFVFSSIFL